MKLQDRTGGHCTVLKREGWESFVGGLVINHKNTIIIKLVKRNLLLFDLFQFDLITFRENHDRLFVCLFVFCRRLL